MEKKKSFFREAVYALEIATIVALALLLALPVFWYMQKADRIERSLSQERLAALTNEKAELTDLNNPAGSRMRGGIDAGQRTTRYEAGAAILTVSPQNIIQLTPDDFRRIGATPFSLFNTVGANQNVPSVVGVVFDNQYVVGSFLARQTTRDLLNDPRKLADMVKNNDPVITRFFANPAAVETLDNEPMMLALSASALMYQILQSPAGQYFIKNPQISRRLVEDNTTLAPLLQNNSLRKFLETNPQTRDAADEFYREQN